MKPLITIKWERTGLLKDVPLDKQDEVSILLENMARDIISGKQGSRIDGKYNGQLLVDIVKSYEVLHRA